jgi:hypothetical protein
LKKNSSTASSKLSKAIATRLKNNGNQFLTTSRAGATKTGAQVAETLSARAREAQVAMRSSREAALKAMHTMTQNCATLVSGVLIGLSERPLNRERKQNSNTFALDLKSGARR